MELVECVGEIVRVTSCVELTEGEELPDGNVVNVEETLAHEELDALEVSDNEATCVREPEGVAEAVETLLWDKSIVELTDAERLCAGDAEDVGDALSQRKLVALRHCVTETVSVNDTDGLVECVIKLV